MKKLIHEREGIFGNEVEGEDNEIEEIREK
jgi:hypothetical protein